VTAAYWAFMLTDGALRMLVLLHFHTLGFTPVQLAYLFLLYEAAGVVTNLSAGWIAARFGLTSTLYAGLILQIGALAALAQLDPGWTLWLSVAFVMAGAGRVGRGQGPGQDVVEIGGEAAGAERARARCSAGWRR
jgi:predicted MFS family arabinose efflux permease